MLVLMTTTAVLEAITDPTRRRILDAVRGGECSVGELVEIVGMHQPGVSRHLKVLRDAGLVEARHDANRCANWMRGWSPTESNGRTVSIPWSVISNAPRHPPWATPRRKDRHHEHELDSDTVRHD